MERKLLQYKEVPCYAVTGTQYGQIKHWLYRTHFTFLKEAISTGSKKKNVRAILREWKCSV